jgi:small subunit ribosomal protein S4
MADEIETTEEIEETSAPETSEDAGRGLRYQKSSSVCRKCRRMGQKLFLKGERCFSPKCSFVRRKYAPGEHGQKPSRLSDYGQQLKAKQKACSIYDIRDNQLRKIVTEASKTPTSTKDRIAELLELRLDSVIYQAGLALSRRAGRQLITHGKVKVNGNKVTSPSYRVSKGDKLEVDKKMTSGNLADSYKRLRAENQTPVWLSRDSESAAEVVEHPKNIADSLGFDIQSIIEFYSR